MLRVERAIAGAPALGDVVALVKPRIMMMALVTMAGAMALAPGSPPGVAIAWAMLGTALIVGAANTLNMYLERDIDCLMARTKDRPLPDKRMDPAFALGFGLAQTAVALPILSFALDPLCGLIGAAALIAYVMVYTPLKQRTTAATLIGAFPGAAPALIGWVAATGTVDVAGAALFGVLFLWQMPHFHAIAMFRRKDYARAGLKVLPQERGERATRRTIALYLAAQVALSIALGFLGVAGALYLVVATGLGAAYLGYGLWGLVTSGGPRWARRLFFASILYLPALFGALVASGLQ
jgi:protoheme IX farnesyltransferase